MGHTSDATLLSYHIRKTAVFASIYDIKDILTKRCKKKGKMRARLGRHGFRLVNPELLDCKFEAMVELQECYNTMFQVCMVDCDH